MKPVHFFARSCRKTLRGLRFVTRGLGGLRLFGTNSEVSMDPHTGEEEKVNGCIDIHPMAWVPAVFLACSLPMF
jgi:hypothetical protein